MADVETRLIELENELKTMKSELADKDKKLRELQDIEAIKRLQCAYGFYLERWLGEEIIDCFSKDPEVSATFIEGTYKGPEGIRRYFGKSKEQPPEFLHQVMQVNPVITVDPDGKRAWGRWYGYGAVAFRPYQNQIDPTIMSVVYEMEYIKEDGVWKILKFALQMHYAYNTRRILGMADNDEAAAAPTNVKLSPDEWADYDYGYPSGYVYPFHFVHPVTGKPSSEAEKNAKLNLRPSSFQPD
ncbi:MAG: nuclear transport factor 2 family protein [Dehalococcoidales bacterium]|nr:nuclear transport factor 2 family protein [Dehalococcoidales bacterium]